MSIPTGVPGVSIDARPNGTFRVCWRYDGKQPRVTVDSVRTAKMLAKWLGKNGKDRLADDPALLFAIGRTVSPVDTADPVTVKEALDAILATVTPRSLHTRQHQVALLADLHDVNVQALTRADVEGCMDPLVARLAENTWRPAGGLLKRALLPHGRDELVKGYAGKSSKRGRRVRRPVLMTKAEMDELVWTGHDYGIGDLLAIVTDLGLRFGEAAALRGTHVEKLMGHRMVLIREQHPANPSPTAANPHPAPLPLKGAASERDIPPSVRILDMADQARTRLMTTDPKLGGPWRHTEANLRLGKVSRAAIKAGIISRPVKFHDFRHSWGAHLLVGGLDPKTLAVLMGHSSPTITLDIYSHLTDGGVDKARDLLK